MTGDRPAQRRPRFARLARAFAFYAASFIAAPALGQAPALTGVVSSAAEGPMEGVLVTAQRAGSPISITVVSDDKGRFEFPADRAPPGDYAVTIRAAGYELAGAGAARIVAGAPESINLELAPARDITTQLSDTEWLTSIPGSERDKRPLATCMTCHTLERVVKSTHSADEFVDVLRRMANYAYESGDADIPPRETPRPFPEQKALALATYLASINLSRGPWAWRPKALLRPKGRATRAIVTEYHLPRASIAPHDARRDADGYVWYTNSSSSTLGRLDPATGESVDFPYPTPKPGLPRGALALEEDSAGRLWLAMMYQGGLARFDKVKGDFKLFPPPPDIDDDQAQQSMVMPTPSGRVWSNDVGRRAILRLDPASERYDIIEPFKTDAGAHTPYGMAADPDGNLWFLDFGGASLARVDARTLATTLYPTPTPGSHPRRGMIAAGKLWFAEFGANKIGAFDMESKSFSEWSAPTPYTFPYDAFADREGDVWSAGMASDRVLRLVPETGDMIEYALPRRANIRRVFVDNSTPRPTFWAGDNHGATIIRVEPLD